MTGTTQPERPLVAAALLLLLGACGGGGGAYASNTGGPPGAACDPATHDEGCNPSGAPIEGSQRMKCDPATRTWRLIEPCPTGTKCREKQSATRKSLRRTACDGTPFRPVDAGRGSSGGEADGGARGGADRDDPVCKRWRVDRADMSEGKWDGDLAACTVGKLDATGHTNALRLLNLYRHLVGLPEVKESDELAHKAQACAVLMGANDDLSHTPSKTWKCWTAEGSEAAGASNLSTAPAVLAIDRYMVDEGKVNAPILGHRRWLLSEILGPVGIGSTNDTADAKGQASCVWVEGTSTFTYPKGWAAWPPGGKLPIEAIRPHARYGSVDETGWSVQSNTIDLGHATVTVREGTAVRPVKVRQLQPGIATKHAIAFRPDGWESRAGSTYEVSVGGIDKPFTYYVQMLDCE